MAVNVIDTIKPKNNGTFPVVEAVDVKVTTDKRLDAVLNEKADASDITLLSAQIALKADATDLVETNAVLSTKANTSDVNTALASKANVSDLNNKANLSDLTTLSGKVDDVEAEQTTLSARMDEFASLTEGSTTGDAELADIRVGANGTTYNNAGTAVRTQISDLSADLAQATVIADSGSKAPAITFVNKGCDAQGNLAGYTNTKRVSSENLIYIPKDSTLVASIASTYAMTTYLFDDNKTFISNTSSRTPEISGNTCRYVRFAFGKGNEELPTTEIEDALTCTITTDFYSEFDDFKSDVNTYETATDKRISDLERNNEIHQNSPYEVDDIVFINRGITPQGEISSYEMLNRATHEELINIPSDCKLTASVEGYIVALYFYDENKTFKAMKNGNNQVVDGAEYPYVRILLGTSEGIITPAQAKTALTCIISVKPKDKITEAANAIMSEIVLADTTKKVVLLGDSITQGVGSTGYVQFTTEIEGETYIIRGNGPNYPDAGPDYQVGDLIYEYGNKMWYEALDGNGWGQQMKAYFESKFNCVVKNYGCSGIDTALLVNIVNQKIVNSDFDIVIINIGTNDRTKTLEGVFTNLTEVVTTLKNKGKKVILIGNIPSSVSNEENFTIHMEDINHVVLKSAIENYAPFISLYKEFINYCKYTGIEIDSLLKDGLHPNDNGYTVMFNLLCDALDIVPKRPSATW